jgi:hypothetical protein
MKLWISGFLCYVLRLLETDVSEAMLSPSSGLIFVVMEMYPERFLMPNLRFSCLRIEVVDFWVVVPCS